YAAALPAANGTTAQIDLDFDNSRAVVGTTEFTLTAAAWPEIVGHLSHLTGNHPMLGQTTGSIGGGEHAMHMMGQAMSEPRVIPGLGDKRADLPAGYYTATATLARSKLKKEFVDIPLGEVK